MNHNWKYTTTGETASTINMHDCIVTEWERGDNYLALIFGGGFCVNDGNEHNHTGRHLLTGRSALVLRGGAFISAEIPEYEIPKNGELEKRPAILLIEADCDGPDIEVIDWKYDAEASNFFIHGQLNRDIEGYRCPLINLCFSCEAVIYCWNDYTGDAWYEEFERFVAIQKTFKKLGFESHVINLSEPAQRCFGASTHDTYKISVFKRPDNDTVYEVGNADDNTGFVIRTAQSISAIERNDFTIAINLSHNINAAELRVLVEKWLEANTI